MTHIPGFDRSQLLLLPEAIDDYVSVDNPVRFINAFVDGLDLKAAGFERVEAKATGRPGYAPGDLLKLYIYGYLNRVRSSRRLEAECHRNIEIIWLLGGLKPDFKTIADFRSDNRAAFKKVFREFVILCRRLDLFGRELLAVDGKRIKAVNNKDRNFTTGSLQKFIEAADKKLEDYLKRLDAGDAEERATGGSRVENLTEKIEALRKKRSEYAAHRSAQLFPQGRVPLRRETERLHLSGRPGADADPRRQTARIEKSRLRQSPSLPHLRAALALHEGCSRRLAPRKRGRARSHGRATEGETQRHVTEAPSRDQFESVPPSLQWISMTIWRMSEVQAVAVP
jgi:transposase